MKKDIVLRNIWVSKGRATIVSRGDAYVTPDEYTYHYELLDDVLKEKDETIVKLKKEISELKSMVEQNSDVEYNVQKPTILDMKSILGRLSEGFKTCQIKEGDLSDLGNEIGYQLGNILQRTKIDEGYEMKLFNQGFKHGMNNGYKTNFLRVIQDTLLNLGEEQIREVCENNGWRYRCVAVDGKYMAVTCDFDPKRINYELTNGFVTDVNFG